MSVSRRTVGVQFALAVALALGGLNVVAQLSDLDGVDLYEVLEVDDSASEADIKRSYRKLSVKYHPDKVGGKVDQFNRIRDAYEILSDPSKRVLYDSGGVEAVRQAEKGNIEEG